MKFTKAFISAILSISALSCAPQPAYAQAKEPTKCEMIAKISAQFMELRQLGASLPEVLKTVEGDNLLTSIALQAYEEPRYASEEYQQKAIQDFSNLWFLGCYKATKGKTKGSV